MQSNNSENSTPLSCFVNAPTRVDLAGGTLDMWPIVPILQEKFDLWNEPIQTVNIAISLFARARVSLAKGRDFSWEFSDPKANLRESGKDFRGESAKNFPLARSVARFFSGKILEKKMGQLYVETSGDAPRGSGLGGSSSLVVALLAAHYALLGEQPDKKELCLVAQNLEAGILGSLAGNQDHFAAAYGGVQSVFHSATCSFSSPIPCDGKALMNHIVLAYSGHQHFSAYSNWQILEKVLTGQKDVLQKLANIATLTKGLPTLLESADWVGTGKLMSEEWHIRRDLAEGISTPTLDEMYNAAMRAGAQGGKVCGAGGGGVLVVVLKDPQHRSSVAKSIEGVGGIVLLAEFAPQGVSVTFG